MHDTPPPSIRPAPDAPTDASVSAPSTARRVMVNTASLAGSSLWRIFISFVLQVLITRVLGVAAFGQYVSALAYLNVAQVVSELGLTTLLVRDLAPAPSQRRATTGWRSSCRRARPWSRGAGWRCWPCSCPSPSERDALWLAGASLPFYAVTSASQTLFKASERMELVMGVEAVINTLIMTASIAVLLAGGGVTLLIGVLVVTQAISALLCLWLVRRQQLLAALPTRPSICAGSGRSCARSTGSPWPTCCSTGWTSSCSTSSPRIWSPASTASPTAWCAWASS
ncbi:MAG: oligosaccharide flippase family protein [Caldilineaceae bacterium]